jgi:hypothetical protein
MSNADMLSTFKIAKNINSIRFRVSWIDIDDKEHSRFGNIQYANFKYGKVVDYLFKCIELHIDEEVYILMFDDNFETEEILDESN